MSHLTSPIQCSTVVVFMEPQQSLPKLQLSAFLANLIDLICQDPHINSTKLYNLCHNISSHLTAHGSDIISCSVTFIHHK
jgi:hypothetical protein